VYAVARWAADLGIEGLAQTREVRRALCVAAKLVVPAGTQKLPLDWEDLRSVVRVLGGKGGDEFIAVRDAAMFLLGWAGMFRASQLVSIWWEELQFLPQQQGVVVFVPKSKTDQSGEDQISLCAGGWQSWYPSHVPGACSAAAAGAAAAWWWCFAAEAGWAGV
jgi:hypothetical protein